MFRRGFHLGGIHHILAPLCPAGEANVASRSLGKCALTDQPCAEMTSRESDPQGLRSCSLEFPVSQAAPEAAISKPDEQTTSAS
jgi:hypothetical protein